jgi:hypothetical protein
MPNGLAPIFSRRCFHHEGHEENGIYYLFPRNFVFFVVKKQ